MKVDATQRRAGQRPLTPNDLCQLEGLGEVALSPDGRWLAYVIKRPRSDARFHKYDFLDGADRADVWLVEADDGTPENLTRGADDGSGYWSPSWSPDSARLAMLSTKGGNVHLWGWDLRSRGLARLSERPVDLGWRGASSVWVSDRRLLVATLPEGERPLLMTAEIAAVEVAMREWPKTWQGRQPTASTLESGSDQPFSGRPQGQLRLVDAMSGEEQVVLSGFFRELRVAPDRRHVAFLRQVDVLRPHGTQKLDRSGSERHRLGIVTAAGEVVSAALDEIEQPVGRSLRWSHDGSAVALIGRRDGEQPEAPRQVFRYALGERRAEAISPPRLEPTTIVWTDDGRIVALASSANAAEDAGQRADWWLLGGEEGPQKLSAEMRTVPSQLIPETRHGSFVGIADGDVFRLSLADARWENLTASLDSKITWLVWPRAAMSDGESFDELVLAMDEGPRTAWRSLDLASGEVRSLRWPTARGWLLELDPEHRTAVPVSVDRSGARLWLSRPAFEQYRTVVETNTWLSGIAEGELRRIDYQGLDGDRLGAWLILPVDHEEGRRHPLVTWVYPGAVSKGEAPPRRILSIASHHALDFQLLPARGYAVLLPSMPLKAEDGVGDPYLELTKGVIPAVDEAIGLGIADPDRLGLIGQSYGGYGTYGLITQTSRFRAAVALAGFADLASLYGQFDPRKRYDDYAHEDLFRMSLAESDAQQMGAPPWQDTQRYVRNSPIFRADRVETPVLIIQGDMDYVPIEQGEQFFSALYRQGKRARFVRYWGEGHVLQSPANIRHMWNEIYGWFDEYLKPEGARAGASGLDTEAGGTSRT